jgi:uncharacterized protein YeaO (DUF488 family)
MTRQKLRIKRVYQPPDAEDGVRVLVDRLWPRGLSRERAQIDLWLKEIAPSNALRRRFHGDPEHWEEFKTAYYAELKQAPAQSAAGILLDRLSHEPVTLLFAARDEVRNNAVALKSSTKAEFGSVGHRDRLVLGFEAAERGGRALGLLPVTISGIGRHRPVHRLRRRRYRDGGQRRSRRSEVNPPTICIADLAKC